MRLVPVVESRRAMLKRTISAGALLTVVAASGCAQVPALTPASVVSYAGSAAQTMLNVLKDIGANAPNLIPAGTLAAIEADLVTAVAVANQLSPTLPAVAGASLVQKINGIINGAFAALAMPPLSLVIPPPWSSGVAVVNALLPPLEAFVDGALGLAGSSKAAMRAQLAPTASFASPEAAMAYLQTHPKGF